MEMLKRKAVETLRATEKYTKTDMVYVAKGGFWLGFGQVITALTSFAFSLVVARYVAVETYGLYKYAFSIAAVISTLSLTGLGIIIVNRTARGDTSALHRLTRMSLIYSWPVSIAFLIYSWYCFSTNQPALAVFFIVCAITQPLSNAYSNYASHLNGLQEFKRSSAIWNCINVASVFATGVAAVVSGNFLVMAIATTSVATIGNIIAYTLIKPGGRKDESTFAESTKKDVRDSLHHSMMAVISTLAQHTDKIVTFLALGPTATATYVFAAAIPDQIRALFKLLSRLAQPRLARSNFDSIRLSLSKKIIFASILAAFASLAYIVSAKKIFSIFFPAYIESVIYSQVLALSIFTTLATVPLTALQAHDKIGALYKHTWYSSVVQIGFTLGLTVYFGIWGAVFATVLTRISTFTLSLRALKFAHH